MTWKYSQPHTHYTSLSVRNEWTYFPIDQANAQATLIAYRHGDCANCCNQIRVMEVDHSKRKSAVQRPNNNIHYLEKFIVLRFELPPRDLRIIHKLRQRNVNPVPK